MNTFIWAVAKRLVPRTKRKGFSQDNYCATKTRWAENNIYIKTTSNEHFLLILSYSTMDISSTKRNGAPLTNNEKLMIINVYNYFSEANSKKENHQKVTLRKHVAGVLGVGESTVGRTT